MKFSPVKACALKDGLCEVKSDVVNLDQVLFSGEKKLSVLAAVDISGDVRVFDVLTDAERCGRISGRFDLKNALLVQCW